MYIQNVAIFSLEGIWYVTFNSVFQGAAAMARMYCRLKILITSDWKYFLLYHRWIAGLLVWITIYAVLTALGFCKFNKID